MSPEIQSRPGARGGARFLRPVEIVCWCLAVLGLGAYSLVYMDRTLYQASQERVFQSALEQKSASAVPQAPLEPGAPIGRIEIPRLGLQAIIVESTSSEALRRAVGHVEGTALPGDRGNVALAGHRDTFFRGLRDVRKDDIIRIDTLGGSWQYRVESIQVVDPDDVHVLDAAASPILTLVTCYPFHYTGPAPRRFIVQAREIPARISALRGSRFGNLPTQQHSRS
jgi:sortase A